MEPLISHGIGYRVTKTIRYRQVISQNLLLDDDGATLLFQDMGLSDLSSHNLDGGLEGSNILGKCKE